MKVGLHFVPGDTGTKLASISKELLRKSWPAFLRRKYLERLASLSYPGITGSSWPASRPKNCKKLWPAFRPRHYLEKWPTFRPMNCHTNATISSDEILWTNRWHFVLEITSKILASISSQELLEKLVSISSQELLYTNAQHFVPGIS